MLLMQAFWLNNKRPSFFVLSLPFYLSPNPTCVNIIGNHPGLKIYKRETEFYREFMFEIETNSAIMMSLDGDIREGDYYTIEETTEDVSGWTEIASS